MQRGLFITFEGNDGSGKTTQILKLKDMLQSMGHEVLLVREPGGTVIGEKIRSIVLDKDNHEMCDVSEMLLYAASRAQLVHQVIVPAISKGICVICDRFVDSSLAYQGFGRQLGLENVREANRMAIAGHLPDLTFFLDVDADTAMARRNASGEEADRLEREHMDFHRRVYEGYKQLSEESPERIRRIPVKSTPELVFEEITYHVIHYLDKVADIV